MKVIDLLNKIAKGEEVPNKIKWNDDVWIYSCGPSKSYYTDYEDLFSVIDGSNLNDEVEIIEEEKDIEEIGMCTSGIMGFDGVEHITSALKDKINELVREVNKLRRNNEKENN